MSAAGKPLSGNQQQYEDLVQWRELATQAVHRREGSLPRKRRIAGLYIGGSTLLPAVTQQALWMRFQALGRWAAQPAAQMAR